MRGATMPRVSTNNFSTDGELAAIAKGVMQKHDTKPHSAKAADTALAQNIARIKASNRQAEWRDTATKGLVFVTQPSGNHAWYLFYVPKTGERLRKLKLGEYSREFGLKAARETAVAKRADVDRGADPVIEAKQAKARSLGLKFQGLAERFLKENDRLSASTRKVYEYALKKDAYPAIGEKVVDDVTREDIVAICQTIEKRGRIDPETKKRHKPTSQSDHTRNTISAVFTWAVEEVLATSNPAKTLKKRGQKVARDREPTATEIKALWNGVENKLSNAMRYIIRLSILTGQRRTEVAGALRRVDPGSRYRRSNVGHLWRRKQARKTSRRAHQEWTDPDVAALDPGRSALSRSN